MSLTLQCFGLKQDDKEFVSGEELSCELGFDYIPSSFQFTLEADIRIAKQRIFERRKDNMMLRTSMKTECSIKIEPTEGILLRLFYETFF